jgi:NADH dehydrogenase
LADGRIFDSDLTVLTAGFAVPGLARSSGLIVSASGSLAVTNTLIAASDPCIVGAGDAVVIDAEPLRMSCQSAVPTGIHAAETVLKLAGGREPKPLRRKYFGQSISLGRRSALIQFSDFADRPRRRMLVSGRAAALIKERVCIESLRFGHIGPFGYSWS